MSIRSALDAIVVIGVACSTMAADHQAAAPQPADLLQVDSASVALVGFDKGSDDIADTVREITAQTERTLHALTHLDPTWTGTLTLHRTSASYLEADRSVSGGRFAGNLAFAWRNPPQAHVAVQPLSSYEANLGAYVPLQTRRLVSHEAVHLYRYGTFPNAASHPRWLSDGLAQLISIRVAGIPGLESGALADPFVSTQAVRVKRLVATNAMPRLSDILTQDSIPVGPDGYAISHVVMQFLLREDALPAIVSEARRLGGGSMYTERLGAFALTQLERDADARFTAWIRTLDPLWDEAYRSLDTRFDRWHQAAFDSNAIAWNQNGPSTETWQLSTEISVAPVGKQQMNLLLCRTNSGFISAALGPSFGLSMFRYRSKENTWERLGSAEIPDFAPGQPVAVHVACTPNLLAVSANDVTLTVELEPGEASGPWGLGAQSTSAGMWEPPVLQEISD